MSQIQTDWEEGVFLLALSQLDGIGPLSVRKLLRHFGTAREVFAGKAHELMQVQGMQARRVQSILALSDFSKAQRELEWCRERGIRAIGISDPDYPARLRHCDDAPVILFVRGDADLSAQRMIAIVGTRRITDYGRHFTYDLVRSLAPYNVSIVSGLAYGVDIQAHRAALEYGVPTIAVLGHGLDRMYPASHSKSAEQMTQKGGALLTEFVSGTNPDRENFPMRNRIVAGMCDATVVIESGLQGGSMITAELANGYHRDVFAVPGRIGDDRSEGCNLLIKSHRAHLLQGAADLAYIMAWEKPGSEAKKAVQRKIFVELNAEEERIVACLKEQSPLQADQLALGLQLPTSALMVHLLQLELNGLIRSLPGKFYELT